MQTFGKSVQKKKTAETRKDKRKILLFPYYYIFGENLFIFMFRLLLKSQIYISFLNRYHQYVPTEKTHKPPIQMLKIF